MKITTLFPALGVKNYRVFWITQWIALIGFWLQLTTQQWLVYKMTDSAFLLGLLSACQFTPSLLFTLGTGLWIDHHNKRKILMGTQSLYMLQALLLGLLLLSGHETYGWLLFFAFFLGTIDAFDMPARMAFMPELVGKEALHSAVSLNSTNFNITRIVGPLLAAFLLNYLSYSDIFFLNAVSLIPILFAYAKMNVNTPVIQETNKKPLHEIREGISEARKNPIIFGNLLAAGIVSSLILDPFSLPQGPVPWQAEYYLAHPAHIIHSGSYLLQPAYAAFSLWPSATFSGQSQRFSCSPCSVLLPFSSW